MTSKLSYTPAEFAKLMGVSYSAVRHWLAKGKVPGAYKQGDGKVTIERWRIPHEALHITRTRRGSPKGVRYHSKKDQIKELRAELADLNQRHMALMEKYAGATGRIEKLQREFEHAKGFARLQENHLEDGERQLEDLKGELELAEAHIKTLQGSLEAETANYELYKRLYLEEKAKNTPAPSKASV